MRVNRETLISELESVTPGLSLKENVEQSSCFVFKNGVVMTFNDEIACRRKTSLKIEGAVSAAPLGSLLPKLPDDDIQIDVQLNGKKGAVGELLITSGKRRQAGIRMEKDILLPISSVKEPDDWTPLPSNFGEAIELACQCTGKDESEFKTTLVHMHPKWVEACDNFKLIRYRIKSGIQEKVCVRGASIKHIVPLGMTEMAVSSTWVHFRNQSGLIFSCRRYLEDFDDLSPLLDVKGEPLSLPKGLAEAIEKAEVFTAENADDNQVLVQLFPGKLKIRGEGSSGWYTERKKINYRGQPLEFYIGPKLLVEISQNHNECEVTADRLKIDGGKYKFITVLARTGDEETHEQEETESSTDDE